MHTFTAETHSVTVSPSVLYAAFQWNTDSHNRIQSITIICHTIPFKLLTLYSSKH